MFKNIYNKNLDKIEELANKVNYDDSKYLTECSAIETDFSVKANPVDLHWPVWLNSWVFVYELRDCGFESSCSL